MSLIHRFYARCGWGLQAIYSQPPAAPPQSAELFNAELPKTLMRAKPTMVARLGVSEADALLNHLEMKALRAEKSHRIRWHRKFQGFRSEWSCRTLDLLCNNAGFFPCHPEAVERFADHFLTDFCEADYLGVWGFVPGEQFLARRFCPDAKQFEPFAVEPYYFEKPWSRYLAGLTVLVVHPFVDSIRAQYERREKLFQNRDILPAFNLVTVKAVQSLLSRAAGSDWFEALEGMKQEIDAMNYDVALIGAGAYGLPLCAHVKRQGKIGIQMGGALQILFGIKGRRWDAMPQINKFYNSAWVRPSSDETIRGKEKIESGCYW